MTLSFKIPPPAIRRTTLIWVVALSGLLQAKEGQPIPIADLVTPISLERLDLSPSGRYLGAISEDTKGRRNLIITDLETGKMDPLLGHKDFGFSELRWMTEDRIASVAFFPESGHETLYMAERTKLKGSLPVLGGSSISIIGQPRDRPDRLLIQGWLPERGGNPMYPDYTTAEVDITNTKKTRSTELLWRGFDPPKRYPPLKKVEQISHFSDTNGELTAAIGFRDDKYRVWRYHGETQTWEENSLDLEKKHIHAFLPSDQGWWVSRINEEGNSSLSLYDPESGEWEDPVLEDSEFDLRFVDLHFAANRETLAGISYFQKRLTNKWLLPEFELAYTAAQQQRRDLDFHLLDFNDAQNRFLFLGSSGKNPGIYLLVDLDARTVETIGHVSPAWNKHEPYPPRPVKFRSSSGATLDGFITLPKGVSKESPAPLIVLLKSGRIEWRYNALVQFFASRGYVVLQPNNSETTGYIFKDREQQSWDISQMADDVIAATQGALKTGYVDANKVAVYGEGVAGAIATLCLAKESDLFHCAISFDAIYDWKRAIGHPAGAFMKHVKKSLESNTNENGLEEISVLKMVEKINGPVFLAGNKSPWSPIAQQFRKFSKALKSHGVPVTTFSGDLNANRTFSTADRTAYFEEVERFLNTHIGN